MKNLKIENVDLYPATMVLTEGLYLTHYFFFFINYNPFLWFHLKYVAEWNISLRVKFSHLL